LLCEKQVNFPMNFLWFISLGIFLRWPIEWGVLSWMAIFEGFLEGIDQWNEQLRYWRAPWFITSFSRAFSWYIKIHKNGQLDSYKQSQKTPQNLARKKSHIALTFIQPQIAFSSHSIQNFPPAKKSPFIWSFGQFSGFFCGIKQQSHK
jgi:hypothetical protein